MGFLELLTIVLVVLKAIGVLDWSWVAVFVPEMVSVGVWLIFALLSLVAGATVKRKIDRF